MLAWITNWWSSNNFSGPARNAPNDGKKIKSLFDQRPKQVIIITSDEIKTAISKLKKVDKINTQKSTNNPMFEELYSVFQKGIKNYFNDLKHTRSTEQVENRSLEEKIKVRDKVIEILKKKKELKQEDSNSLEIIKKRNMERRNKTKN